MFTLLATNSDVEVVWIVFGAGGAREGEARRAATTVLARAKQSDVRILGFPDSFFPYDGAAIKSQFERSKMSAEG